jgi:hypothetical protein
MPYERIDEALIDAFQGAIANEAVTQNMPAPQHLPLRAAKRSFELPLSLIPGKRLRALGIPLAESVLPARMHFEPLLDRFLQKIR